VAVITHTLLPRNCLRDFVIINARALDAELVSRAVTLSPVPESVAAGRQWSRETIADWKLDEVANVAAQLVSELVTNSVEHAQTECVCLTLTHAEATLWIDVSDDDAATLPTRRRARPDDIRGRGLTIIEAISDRWGVCVTGSGKSVWCALAVQRRDWWRD
jgi:anti-sigma regulatory factor (Ser/Thr protein kinase)